jgi:hypothetical protein
MSTAPTPGAPTPGAPTPGLPPSLAHLHVSTTAINPPPYYNKPAGEKHGMQYVRLGNTGAVVSRICLGVMLFGHFKPGEAPMFPFVKGQEDGEAIVRQALDAGITFFDTAEAYSNGRSETFLGIALKKLLPQSKFTREDVFVATKVMPTRAVLEEPSWTPLQRGLSRKALFAALDGSLQRLQCDYVDLFIIHRFDANHRVCAQCRGQGRRRVQGWRHTCEIEIQRRVSLIALLSHSSPSSSESSLYLTSDLGHPFLCITPLLCATRRRRRR